MLKDNIQGVANVYSVLDEDTELLQRIEQLVEMKDKQAD